MNINYDKLRDDLINFFGAAMMYNKVAMIELIRVENCSDDELINIAIENGFDLNRYIDNYTK